MKSIWAWLKKYHLLLLLAAVAVKQIVLIGLIPIWQVFDEPAHFQYTQTIIEDHRFPVYQPNYMNFSSEVWTSYVTVTKKLSTRFNLYPPIPDYPFSFSSNERQSVVPGTTPTNLAAPYGPVYYLLEGLPYLAVRAHSLSTRLTAMRLFSSLWLVITVWLAYRLIRRLRGSPGPAFAVATMVGFFPMLGYVAAGVNNDIFLVMLVTAALGRSVQWWSKQPTRRELIVVGALAGLAAMTKQQGMIMIFLVAIIYWRTYRGQPIGARVQRLGWFLIPAIVTGCLWSAWSLLVGSNFITNEGQTRFVVQRQLGVAEIAAHDIFIRTKNVWVSGWGQFGWNQFYRLYPMPIYLGAFVLTAVAIVGWWKLFRRPEESRAWRQWLSTSIIGLALLEILYQGLYWQEALTHNIIRFPNQGRYYFLLIVPLLSLLMAGIEQFVNDRDRKWVWLGLSGLMIGLTAWSVQLLWVAFSTIH